MRSGSEYVGRTAGEEKEDSKETIGFVAEDSKGDRVPFGTRLSVESLVCYTFMKQTEYGNGMHHFDARSISVLFCAKGTIISWGTRGGHYLMRLFPYACLIILPIFQYDIQHLSRCYDIGLLREMLDIAGHQKSILFLTFFHDNFIKDHVFRIG